MKCYSCGKNFDYEKYYGICPKCGCYNKKETAEEQHQQYHEQYDNGYRHTGGGQPGYNGMEAGQPWQNQQPKAAETAAPVYIHVDEQKKSSRGSTIFLLVSLAVFLTVMAGGTAFSVMYQKKQKEKLQEEVVEARTDRESHALGETFSLQGMKLTVVEAWAVDEGRKTYPDFPEGKKLAVVKLRGESDGEWADKNRLSDTYISCIGSYYKQVPTYEIDWEGGIPRDFPLFESYSLCMSSEAEGCLFFWVDEEVQDITLFLEERVGEDLVFIQTIHSVEVHLEEMDLGGQADA